MIYRGDVVLTGPDATAAVVRLVRGDRVKVQVGDDWTWLPAEDLVWLGDVIGGRLPHTERGWRRLGRAILKWGINAG